MATRFEQLKRALKEALKKTPPEVIRITLEEGDDRQRRFHEIVGIDVTEVAKKIGLIDYLEGIYWTPGDEVKVEGVYLTEGGLVVQVAKDVFNEYGHWVDTVYFWLTEDEIKEKEKQRTEEKEKVSIAIKKWITDP